MQLGYSLSLTAMRAVVPWTPAMLGAAAVGWWDASDASTITLNGSSVSAWASKVGGITASQATGANQPAYSATARNGKPGVTGDGVSDRLVISSIAAFPAGSAPSTIISVSVLLTAGSWPKPLAYGTLQSGQERAAQGHSNTGTVGIGIAGTDNNSGVSWLSDRIVVAEFTNATTRRLVVDGTAYTFAPSGNMNTVAGSGWLFGSPGNTHFYSGVIQEVMVINRTLITEERQKLEGYLAWKWGLVANLPSNHPHKNAPPTA